MIDPVLEDVGRRVIYTGDRHLKEKAASLETGTITSFNSRYVFVRYSSDPNSRATLRQDLEWEVIHQIL